METQFEKKQSNIRKVEEHELPPVERTEIGADEALFIIAQNEELRKIAFPEKLNKALDSGKDPKELFEGEFKNVLDTVRNSKELTDEMSVLSEGPLKIELLEAAKEFMKEKYDIELSTEIMEKYKIEFMDLYRWLAFFMKRRGKISTDLAQVFTGEKLIAINAEKRFLDTMGNDKGNNAKMKLVLLHEFLHALSHVNYWGIEESDKIFPIERRMGFASARLGKVGEGEDERYQYHEILNRLYEGVIEDLNMRIGLKKLGPEAEVLVIKSLDEGKYAYAPEIDVLIDLNEKVPMEYFARAVFEKDGLGELAEKMREAYGPRSLEIIGELMNWEAGPECRKKSFGYPVTQKFIKGEEIKIPANIFFRVPPEFIKKHYPNAILK